MRRVSLARSTPFRLAALFSAVFVTIFVCSGILAIMLTRAQLAERLDLQVEQTFNITAGAYGTGDLEDLVAAVQGQVAALNSSDDRIFSLTSRQGARLAGNAEAGDIAMGASTITAPTNGSNEQETYRIFAGDIGGNRLVVGQSYSDVSEVSNIMATTFGWAGGIALLATGAIATFLTSRLRRRIADVEDVLSRVSQGDLNARIKATGQGDDIDMIVSEVNAMLDRLRDLFNGMKQVSTDIAHELKTPLNRLKLVIARAIDAEANGGRPGYLLMEAAEESDRINATFDALLRIAQMEAGARKSRFKPLSLADLVGDIAEAYTDVAADAAMTMTLSIEGGASLILGDRDLLAQLCANLVENAIRHCPPQTMIRLGLSTEAGVRLTVADNGPGIPASERNKVFRRLYRLEKSRSTPGSGLGLSLAKAIADLHGARLVLSDNNPGLRVTIYFPALSVELLGVASMRPVGR